MKYSGVFQGALGIELHKADEMGCLVAGINFLLTNYANELYTIDHNTYMYGIVWYGMAVLVYMFSLTRTIHISAVCLSHDRQGICGSCLTHLHRATGAKIACEPGAPLFPYLLVNIGRSVCHANGTCLAHRSPL